jgi:GT2 family glycosyltransferase
MGVDIPGNYNNMLMEVRKKDYEWVWILGDDHVFKDDLLMNLLDRDVDIVVPLCAMRHKPFNPVIRKLPKDYSRSEDWNFLQGKSGLVELTEQNVGNGGMLIRRKVISMMKYPWFENGKIGIGTGCDLYFCEKAREAGFKIHLDLDNVLGHITQAIVWPKKTDNTWNYDIQTI